MVSIKTILFAGACALTATASPIRRAVGITPEMILAIAPGSGVACTNKAECATNQEAATAINNAFAKWQITDPMQQAAMVAYMAFESVDFKYNTNQAGRAGQGTKMMAMPSYVLKYAEVAADPAELAAAKSKTGDDQLNAIRATVIKNNDLSFGSAPWFLTTQCTDDVKAGLTKGTMDAWHNFLTKCVNTPLDPARDVPYQSALKAFADMTTRAPAPAQSSQPASHPVESSKPVPPVQSSKTVTTPQLTTTFVQPTPTPPATQPKPTSQLAPPIEPASEHPESTPAQPAPTTGSTPSSPNTTTGNTRCSTDGAVVCNGEKQFGLCNFGKVVWMDTAAGTACINGAITKRKG